MSVRTMIEKGSLRALGRAFLGWIAAAGALCFLAACVVRAHSVPSASLGYVSSAISFLCALIAGAAGARGEGRLGAGLFCAGALSLALLTVGFLIAGKGLDPSAVLSVLSFTFAGCVAGSLLFGGRKSDTKRSEFRAKKKQKRKS